MKLSMMSKLYARVKNKNPENFRKSFSYIYTLVKHRLAVVTYILKQNVYFVFFYTRDANKIYLKRSFCSDYKSMRCIACASGDVMGFGCVYY